MMSTPLALLIAVGLVALSAFFVAAEFALVAARQYRLEELAERSVAARAALRSSRDLSLLLAGSQLGITLCTLGLGAVAKPAVHDVLMPIFEATGLPSGVANAVAFVLALFVVTFVHLVVGEMAPKSWAIAHPERSATLLALPMRAFMTATRPMLLALNGLANACLRRVGVEPVDEVASAQTPQTLRALVDHSADVGALDEARRRGLLTALELDSDTVRTLVRPQSRPVGVAATDDATRIRAVARDSGHLRLVVRENDRVIGMVHVRDALDVDARATARTLRRPVLTLPADEKLYQALTTMRQHRGQFALVMDGDIVLGLITMQDLLDRLLPRPLAAPREPGQKRTAAHVSPSP
jgi:CBS domain containing-hemolysin-like protein